MIEPLVTNNRLVLPGFKTSQTLRTGILRVTICLMLSINHKITLTMTAAATLKLLAHGYFIGLCKQLRKRFYN